MNKDFLIEMLSTPSVSGNEYALQKKIIKHMKPLCDEILTDHVGNVISVINKNAKTKILLDAHIDEIGLVISNVKEDGRCKVEAIGAIRPSLYLGQQVSVITKSEIINGVIAQYRPIQNDKIDVSELELDLGTFSKQETLNKIAIGDYVVHKNYYLDMGNDIIAGRALDDKIGVYAILKALLLAKELGVSTGVYASSTVGEETTANGASHLGHLIKPTIAIVVDVTTDTLSLPSLSNHDAHGIGLGPTISLGTIMNKKLSEIIMRVAKEQNIPLTPSTTGGRTYTNADKIHFTNDGIPTILLNIPLRYMHSSSEVVSLKDVDNLSKLIAYTIKEINEQTNFKPF